MTNNSSKENKETDGYKDDRTFIHVLLKDALQFIYFFAPLLFAHLLALLICGYDNDARGPWERLWHQFLRTFGHDKYVMYVFGTAIVTTVFYWISAVGFMALDFTQKPAFLMKYKMQLGKNWPPDYGKTRKAVLQVLFNQTLTIPMGILSYDLWLRVSPESIWYLPDMKTAMFQVFVCMLVHDVIFYHVHRLLHHKSIYKYIHKMHHEWTAPIALTSAYAHPVEHIMSNQFSLGLGPLLTGAPLPVAWLWLCWYEFQTQNDHCGYHFPIVFSPEFHDFHHLKFHTSYGWLHFWDWVYGTDQAFQENVVHRNRHIRLHSSASARQLFPDPEKKAGNGRSCEAVMKNS